MPRVDGTTHVIVTMRSGVRTLIVAPDFLELRRRVSIAGVARLSERQAAWFDALTPLDGKLVCIDLSEVALLEEAPEHTA